MYVEKKEHAKSRDPACVLWFNNPTFHKVFSKRASRDSAKDLRAGGVGLNLPTRQVPKRLEWGGHSADLPLPHAVFVSYCQRGAQKERRTQNAGVGGEMWRLRLAAAVSWAPQAKTRPVGPGNLRFHPPGPRDTAPQRVCSQRRARRTDPLGLPSTAKHKGRKYIGVSLAWRPL